jgi:hypothetical protein
MASVHVTIGLAQSFHGRHLPDSLTIFIESFVVLSGVVLWQSFIHELFELCKVQVHSIIRVVAQILSLSWGLELQFPGTYFRIVSGALAVEFTVA